jgi:predicted NUDIX family phosphoesterase
MPRQEKVAVRNYERNRTLSEKILVVPNTAAIKDNTNFQGFRSNSNTKLWTLFATEGLFLERDMVEYDPRYRQLIVYLVLRHKQDVFIYQRIKATGEKRLLEMYSFGLGGHINEMRGGFSRLPQLDNQVHTNSFTRLITSNLKRELKEEVSFSGPFSYRFLGILNDQETEVGMYHIGLVFRVSCLSPQITVREKNKIRGRLVPVFQLQDNQDKLENWSNILLPYIPELMVVGR